MALDNLDDIATALKDQPDMVKALSDKGYDLSFLGGSSKSTGDTLTNNELTRGIARGALDTGATLTQALPALGESLVKHVSEDLLDTESPVQPTKGFMDFLKSEQQISKDFPARIQSYQDIHNLSDAVDYGASAVGEQIPQLGLMALGGGITGSIAKGLAEKGGVELSEEAANQALQRGFAYGSAATAAAQTIPSAYTDLMQHGQDAPVTSILTGGLQAGLMIMPQMNVLSKILGSPELASTVVGNSLLARMGKEGVNVGLQAGAVGAGTEGLNVLAEHFVGANPDLTSPDNINRIVDSGLKFAIGGGLIGAAATPLMPKPELFDPQNPYKLHIQNAKVNEDGSITKGEDTPYYVDKANTTDDTIIRPSYVKDAMLKMADKLGLKTESLNNLSQEQVQDVSDNLEKVKDSDTTSLNDLQKPSQPDPTDNEYGVINEGAKVNDEDTINDPYGQVKVNDIRPLENVNPVKTQSDESPMKSNIGSTVLPRELSGAKPRYKNSELSFPSDVEKALYISTNKSKSKKEVDYKNWLKDNVGLSDKDIDTLSGRVKKSIQAIHETAKAPETIEVPKVELPNKTDSTSKLNRTLDLPFNGNLRDDYMVPKMISNNLMGMEAHPDKLNSHRDVINMMKRIIKEVTGGKGNLEVMDRLYSNVSNQMEFNDPARGAQTLNMIHIALAHTGNAEDKATVAYHEAWHMLENHLLGIDDNDRAIIDRQTSMLKKYADQDGYLSTQDFDRVASTPKGREEIRAVAFGEMMRNNALIKDMPYGIKRLFSQGKNVIERLGNGLRGLGFKSADDIFTEAATGKRATDVVKDVNYLNQMSRLHLLVDQDKANNENEQERTWEDTIRDSRIKENNKTLELGKTMGFWGKYISSMVHDASVHPFIAQVYDSVRRRILNSNNLLEGFVGTLGDFNRANKDQRYRLHELADYMRKTEQKGKLNSDGNLEFERDGKKVTLGDKEASRRYMQMQAAYGKVLDGWEDFFKKSAHDEFHAFLKPDFNKADIDKLLADKTLDKEKSIRLKSLQSTFNHIEEIRNTDVIPSMRFGSLGFVTRDKDGNQVALHSIENGDFRKLYNKYQLEQATKDIKEKYGDSSKYDVIGSNGIIRSFEPDNMVPFKMTYNTLKNHIDPRFLNVDMLMGLLASKDPELLKERDEQGNNAFEKLSHEIYNDILTRGFEKRFSGSKDIEGYSKDWDRVQHSYLAGASHYLSGLPHYKELSALKREAANIKDDVLKHKAETYIDYTSSPQQDFQLMRNFNFLWTMGVNPSTAMLQFMTLPTTTLGNLNRLDPNVIRNMARIGKWTAIGLKHFLTTSNKTVYMKDGLMHVDFNNSQLLDKLVKNGTITDAQKQYLGKISNLLRGFLTEEYSGYKPYETRSLGGSFRAKSANIANLLGLPVSLSEQMTRFATTMAAFETLEKNPDALNRAKESFKDDHRYQAQLANQKSFTDLENTASFIMDNAHGVFGKVGRPPIYKGIGGSLFFPFMTYSHQMLEGMSRMLGEGKDGRRAFAVTMTSMFLLSGLLGLPGFDLMKELMEAGYKQWTGIDTDLDLLMREKIYDMTGDPKFAKFITQGLGRAYAGLDVSKRIGFNIPGQEMLMNILGIKGQSSTDLLGVQGSLISGIGQAWQQYNNGGGPINVAKSLVPTEASNMLKAYDYNQSGVQTQNGVQLVRPEDVTAKTTLARALGITSDQVATAREQQYYAKLAGTKYQLAIDRLRSQAVQLRTDMVRAQNKGDFDTAKALQDQYKTVIMELGQFAQDNKIPVDMGSFNRSVSKATMQRINPVIKPKDVAKVGRQQLPYIKQVLGTQ